MKTSEFKKVYASQISGGKKAFDNFMYIPSAAVALFSLLVWYTPNEFSMFFKLFGVNVILFIGIVLGSIAQIVCDVKIKATITEDIKPFYYKYVAVNAILGILIISGLYIIAIGVISIVI